MKVKLLLLYFIIGLFLNACQQHEGMVPVKGSIAFSLSKKTRSGGRITEIAKPASVLLSIIDDQGNPVLENKKLSLFSFGDSYVSESLEMAFGSYALTTFMVLDASDKVIYATPLEGTDLASLVTDALPIHFSVSENNTKKIVPQVLAITDKDQPENFGYVSFGLDIVVPEVKIKTRVALVIGSLIYPDIDTKITITGFNKSNEKKWSQEYNYVGPKDNELSVKRGYDHYSIEISKWGVSDKHTITGQQLWNDRANGPNPFTYVLGGAVDAKRLKYTIHEMEMPAGNGETYMMIDSKTEYEYNSDKSLKKTTDYSYSSVTDKFEPSGYSTEFLYQNGKVSKVMTYYTNQLISEYEYFYAIDGNVSKIKQKQPQNGEVNFIYNWTDETVKAIYTFSGSGGFVYDFFYDQGNIVSDKTTQGVELCNDGNYTYDKNINPFHLLGYVSFDLQNFSVNNQLTEKVNYVACSFPSLIPDHYEYEYDQDGYPVYSTTYYKSKGSKIFKSITFYEYF